MNRSHLWRFLIIVVVVGWAATDMLPLKSRPLIEMFQENIGKRDAAYTNIITRFAELQKANPQNEYKNLRMPSAPMTFRGISTLIPKVRRTRRLRS